MALAVVSEMASGVGASVVNATSLTFAFNCNGGTFLVVSGTAADSLVGDSVTSAVYNASALTFEVNDNGAALNTIDVAIFSQLNPASGSNNVVVSSSQTSTAITAGAIAFTGQAATPLGNRTATDDLGSLGTTATITVSNTKASSIVVATAVAGDALSGLNQTTSWIKNVDALTAGDNGASQRAAGGGSPIFNWTIATNNDWAAVAVEVFSAVDGVAPVRGPPRRFKGPNPVNRFQTRQAAPPATIAFEGDEWFELWVGCVRVRDTNLVAWPRAWQLLLCQDELIIVPPPPIQDEDFWQNGVAPVPATMGRLYLRDLDDLPATTLFGQPDEDFWQNRVAPVAATLGPLYLLDRDDLPANTLFGQPDEDFWRLGPAPSLTLFGKLYLPDPEELVVAAATTVVDEDYWVSGVPPALATLRVLPFQDDEAPAGSLFGQPDEDFWRNQVAPTVAALGKLYLPDPEELPAGSMFGQPDEDFWLLGPRAPLVVLGKLYLPDPDELVVPQAGVGIPDEDFWVSGVPPAPSTLFVRLPLGDPEELPAGSLFGAFDEDFWVAPRSSTSVNFVWAAPDAGDLPIQVTIVDEDFWSTYPRPQLTLFGPLYLFNDELTGVHPPPDEVYWSLAPRQVVSTWWTRAWQVDGEIVPVAAQGVSISLPGILGRQDLYVLLAQLDALGLLGRVDLYVVVAPRDGLTLLGRQDSYAIGGFMPLNATLTIPLGDDVTIPMTLQNADTSAFNLTGATITVGVKKLLSDTVNVLTKTIANGGIVVTNAAGGLANLLFVAADTATNFPAGAYPFDVQVTLAGKKATLLTGTIVFVDHPTR